jgi:Undecaprenyl-phosphate glucose phosphotransferase
MDDASLASQKPMSLVLEPRTKPDWGRLSPVAERDARVRPQPIVASARADRRGPLRPGRLIASRSRLNGDVLAQGFRAVDATVAVVLAWLACDVANPAGVLASPVGAVAPFGVAALLLVFFLHSVGAYAFRTRETVVGHLARIAGAFALTGVVLEALLVVPRPAAHIWNAQATWFCLAFASLYLLHTWWWFGVRRLRRSGRLTPNVVIVGATENAERLVADALARREIAVLGVFDDRRARSPAAVRGVRLLGDTKALIDHRIMPFVDRIVITVTASAQGRVRALVERLRVLPNEVTLFIDFGGDDARGAALSRLGDIPLATLSGAQMDARRALVKRAQDLVLGVTATIAAAPIMLAVAIAVRLDSPGPILFRQRRQGFNNEEIVVWKFRSMRHDQRDERAVRQVRPDDPRVTRVGAFIRQTSLDELPQLLNVLRGEMSLVGPRPHAPGMKTGEVESVRLVAEYAHRHRIKPGVTGWAAIRGSRGPLDTPESVRRRVALDIEYIERQSFWLDLFIMAMTLPRLLGDARAAR